MAFPDPHQRPLSRGEQILLAAAIIGPPAALAWLLARAAGLL
ncbi:MAG: hypothetical protein AB7O91_04175 [Sphingomonas sp.]